jgi:hypothetical protein
MAVRGTVANRSPGLGSPVGIESACLLHLSHVEEGAPDQMDFSGGDPLRFLLAFSSSLGHFLFCQLS